MKVTLDVFGTVGLHVELAPVSHGIHHYCTVHAFDGNPMALPSLGYFGVDSFALSGTTASLTRFLEECLKEVKAAHAKTEERCA